MDQDRPELADSFWRDRFGEATASCLAADEQLVGDRALDYVVSRFGRMKYILGLGIDFLVLAEQLAVVDAPARASRLNLTEHVLFGRYLLVEKRGKIKANTLTLTFGSDRFGIRKTDEEVTEFFHGLDRSGYPSSYVYATGQWHKYKDLLLDCFRLSSIGRRQLANQLIQFALDELPSNRFYGRPTPRCRLLERVLEDYPRAGPNENGGLTFQAIAYGYVSADRPHLDLLADKVRTGSSRQKRFGDIDGYSGLDLELSVEVKDIDITADNVERELGDFMVDLGAEPVVAIAFAKSIDKAVAQRLAKQGIQPYPLSRYLAVQRAWDWPKQNAAVLGTLHYLSHIEQNPVAVDRFLAFIRRIDPNHDALAFSP